MGMATHYARCLCVPVAVLHDRYGRVVDEDWPRLRVVSVAPLIAGALERFLADASIGDLDR
jgi:hypothetical protein